MQKPFEVQRELFVVAGDLGHPALCELDGVEALLDWGRLESLMSGIYASETGRPSYPSLTLFRALMLGVWYALSDAALSKSLARDLLFRKFCRLELSAASTSSTRHRWKRRNPALTKTGATPKRAGM